MSRACVTSIEVGGTLVGATVFTYEGANRFRLTQIGGGPTLSYDAAGNLATGPGFTYAYTPDHQLRTATVNGVATQCLRRRPVAGEDGDGGAADGVHGPRPGRVLLSEWTNSTPVATVRDFIYAGGRLIGIMTTHRPPK